MKRRLTQCHTVNKILIQFEFVKKEKLVISNE